MGEQNRNGVKGEYAGSLAGLWENWRNPKTGEWERTFAIITVPSNELLAHIHDRMPAIRETPWLRPVVGHRT